jgi:hypothetical protein
MVTLITANDFVLAVMVREPGDKQNSRHKIRIRTVAILAIHTSCLALSLVYVRGQLRAVTALPSACTGWEAGGSIADMVIVANRKSEASAGT